MSGHTFFVYISSSSDKNRMRLRSLLEPVDMNETSLLPFMIRIHSGHNVPNVTGTPQRWQRVFIILFSPAAYSIRPSLIHLRTLLWEI